MEKKMVVVHYAGINKNYSSGVSVIIPQILNAQAQYNEIGLYNYGEECFALEKNVFKLNELSLNDDYHKFPEPFNKPDLVVFHSPFGIPKSVKVASLLINDKIPYIIVPHGCFSKVSMDQKRVKKMIACKTIFAKMIKNVSAIQYLSSGEQKKSVFNNNFFIVPNGVSIAQQDRRLKKSHSSFIISYIGRKSIYQKGLDLLINACGIIKNNLAKNDIKLNIYGPSSEIEENKIEKMIRENNLVGVVSSFSTVFAEEKEKVLYETDILVLTSRSEGLPGIVLEAWACGCPTLLTPETNLSKEAVDNVCGWEVEGNPNDIAKAILEIYKEKKNLDRYMISAYNHIKKKYTWDIVAQKYNYQYERIVKK